MLYLILKASCIDGRDSSNSQEEMQNKLQKSDYKSKAFRIKHLSCAGPKEELSERGMKLRPSHLFILSSALLSLLFLSPTAAPLSIPPGRPSHVFRSVKKHLEPLKFDARSVLLSPTIFLKAARLDVGHGVVRQSEFKGNISEFLKD